MTGMYIALTISMMLNMIIIFTDIIIVFIGKNRNDALEERIAMLEETVKSLDKWRWSKTK